MNLATHQTTMLGLLRDSYAVHADDSAYVRRVAASRDLQEARGNVLLWRVFVLERTCVLTVTLLRQRRQFEPALQAFIKGHNISPFREYQPPAFLASLAGHADALVDAVARFEHALMLAREGDERSQVVDWPCDPSPVLKALAEEKAPPRDMPLAAHTTRISRELPGLFAIEAAS